MAFIWVLLGFRFPRITSEVTPLDPKDRLEVFVTQAMLVHQELDDFVWGGFRYLVMLVVILLDKISQEVEQQLFFGRHTLFFEEVLNLLARSLVTIVDIRDEPIVVSMDIKFKPPMTPITRNPINPRLILFCCGANPGMPAGGARILYPSHDSLLPCLR